MSAIIVVNDRDNGIQTQTQTHTCTRIKISSPFTLPVTDINIIMLMIIHTDSHWGLVRIIQSGDY